MANPNRLKAPSQRQLRIGEVIRHVLAEVFLRDVLRDPDLVGVTITVTEARVSPDARNATIFVMPLGGSDSSKVVTALNASARHLRGELARTAGLKHVPSLAFEVDPSFDAADLINSLLKSGKAVQNGSQA